MKLLVPSKAIQVCFAHGVSSVVVERVGSGGWSGKTTWSKAAIAKVLQPKWYSRTFEKINKTNERTTPEGMQGEVVQEHRENTLVRDVPAIVASRSLLPKKAGTGMSGLRATGIGRRWLEMLEQRSHSAEMARAVDDLHAMGGAVGRLASGVGRGCSRFGGNNMTNSWVCPVCQMIVPASGSNRAACPIERCPGGKPGATPPSAIVKEVRTDEFTEKDNVNMFLQVVEDMLKDDRRDRKRRRNVVIARGWLGHWNLLLLVSLAAAMVTLLACGVWLQAIVGSRYASEVTHKANFAANNSTLELEPPARSPALSKAVTTTPDEKVATSLSVTPESVAEVDGDDSVRGTRQITGDDFPMAKENIDVSKHAGNTTTIVVTGASAATTKPPQKELKLVDDPMGVLKPPSSLWKTLKRLNDWREGYQVEAEELLNGPWY